jgi:predicted nucleic acid-binding protein
MEPHRHVRGVLRGHAEGLPDDGHQHSDHVVADHRSRGSPGRPLITAVTLAELTVGPLVATTEAERAARQAYVQQAEADFDPLPFDAAPARAFGRVAASMRRTGRKPAARAHDAMIAATALAR